MLYVRTKRINSDVCCYTIAGVLCSFSLAIIDCVNTMEYKVFIIEFRKKEVSTRSIKEVLRKYFVSLCISSFNIIFYI